MSTMCVAGKPTRPRMRVPPKQKPMRGPETEDMDTDMDEAGESMAFGANDHNAFFENAGNGDCLYLSLAQIFLPVSSIDASPEQMRILQHNAGVIRRYVAAVETALRRSASVASSKLTEKRIDLLMMTFVHDSDWETPESSKRHIEGVRKHADGTNTELAAFEIGSGIEVVGVTNDMIKKTGEGMHTGTAYVVCNLANIHYRLKRHDTPLSVHDFNRVAEAAYVAAKLPFNPKIDTLRVTASPGAPSGGFDLEELRAFSESLAPLSVDAYNALEEAKEFSDARAAARAGEDDDSLRPFTPARRGSSSEMDKRLRTLNE